MKLLKTLSHSEQPETNTYFLIFCLCLNILLATASAKSVGKGIGINNPHANLHANPHANPHTNLSVNPAGIIAGSGGKNINSSFAKQNSAPISHDAGNIGAVTNPKGHLTIPTGDTLLLGRPRSNVIVKICSPSEIRPTINPLKHTNKTHTQGGHICLAAGDIFSKAITNLNSLSISLEVPEPIGAKGANPGHSGNHPNKGYGNPGGGNGRGNWGKGNKGNGFGNTWTGNQGRGVGEGMACGSQPTPPEPPAPPELPAPSEPPEPPESPGGNEEPYIEPPPLYRPAGWTNEEEEFEEGGCPALMNWLAAELGIEEKNLQVSVAESFIYSTDIQACEAAAKLLDRAKILNDPNGTGVAALTRVVNEFISQDAPISEEQLAMIAEILAAHTDDGTHYAAAGRWLNALLEYVLILKNEMDWSADDVTTLVMDKYCASIQESDNASLMLYVTARLSEV
jgi:hypothetical protein